MILLWLLWILVPLVTSGQWNQVVLLTNDSLDHGTASAVVDDSFRVHLFDVRTSYETSPQHSSVYYQRFDNWGNPLSQAMELFPDSHWVDYAPGVILDRRQNIHVIWCREYGGMPDTLRTFYARFDAQGNVLTPRTEVASPYFGFYAHCCIDVEQDSDGVIWATAFRYVMTISEDGEVLTPWQNFLGEDEYSEQTRLRVTPRGEVWVCYRFDCCPESLQENVSIQRLDTVGLPREVVIDNLGVPGLSVNTEGFFVDSTNAFHYILYRGGEQVFYLRDPRDGSPPDTSHFQVQGAGPHTDFTLVGGDTLTWIWTEGIVTLERIGFLLDGQRAYDAVATPTTLSLPRRFIWKRGSTWVFGSVYAAQNSQLAMIHVPGQNEPANAVSPRPRDQSRPVPELLLYPQPAQGWLEVHLPAGWARAGEVGVFNLMGQRIAVTLERHLDGSLRVQMPGELSTGTYYLTVRSPQGEAARRFTFVK